MEKVVYAKKSGETPTSVCAETMSRKRTSWGVHKCSLLYGSGRDWGNLDPNMLEEVLSRVPIHDLFRALNVCQSWQDICCNILFWRHRVLDLSATGVELHPNSSTIEKLRLAESSRLPGLFGDIQSEEHYNSMAKSLSRLLLLVLGRDSLQGWRSSIDTIILPYDLEISDEHLVYIAERTPCVRHLMLLNTSRVTFKAFSKATQNWRHLKEVHIGSTDRRHRPYFLSELSLYCRQLQFLHLHLRGLFIDQTYAEMMALMLPSVTKVEFDSCWIFPSALIGLFHYGINVEEVYFTRCGLVSYRNGEYAALPPSNEWADSVRLVENFTLSWTECSVGYPRWHTKFMPDGTSATRINKWIWHESHCPARGTMEL